MQGRWSSPFYTLMRIGSPYAGLRVYHPLCVVYRGSVPFFHRVETLALFAQVALI